MQKIINNLQKSSITYEKLNQSLIQIKKMADEYFDGIKMNDEYKYLVKKIELFFEILPLEYICDTTMHFLPKSNKISNNSSLEEKLQYIVYYSIETMIRNNNLNCYNGYDVTNNCLQAAEYVKEASDSLKLQCHIVKIDPGFDEDANLFNGSGFHYFNIVVHNNRYYLVDTSYKQFFKKSYTDFERMGVPFVFNPTAGIYMTLNKFHQHVASIILKKGWIELTDEILKAYMDGFALSYRNALYYEDKELNYVTDYTAKDYKNFLLHEDSQVHHEGTRVLGYQRELTKNQNRSYKVN